MAVKRQVYTQETTRAITTPLLSQHPSRGIRNYLWVSSEMCCVQGLFYYLSIFFFFLSFSRVSELAIFFFLLSFSPPSRRLFAYVAYNQSDVYYRHGLRETGSLISFSVCIFSFLCKRERERYSHNSNPSLSLSARERKWLNHLSSVARYKSTEHTHTQNVLWRIRSIKNHEKQSIYNDLLLKMAKVFIRRASGGCWDIDRH